MSLNQSLSGVAFTAASLNFRGVNPLETKPELQKEFERRKFENRKKEQADNQKKNRTSLEQQLERQFQKIADVRRLISSHP